MTDSLFGQGYFLRFDPKLWQAQRPYPPLGTLIAAAVLRQAGHSVAVFDSMLAGSEREWQAALERHRPRVAILFEDNFNYLSKMCLGRMREASLTMIGMARRAGARCVVSGSDASDRPELYLDGGLRQNTPIAPALRLGATHIFAIGSSHEVKGIVAREGAHKHPRAPGAAFLLGKVLNAFLLDHIDVDINLLTRLNHVLVDGSTTYGDAFTDSMSHHARRRGAQDYRFVHNLTIRPSEDMGQLASAHVRRGRFMGDPIVTKRLFNLLDIGVGDEADLASYLLFDGQYCRQLIEMGRADAKARRDELLKFFGDAAEDGGGPSDEDLGTSGTWERRSIPYGT
jgi:hypothetical protein